MLEPSLSLITTTSCTIMEGFPILLQSYFSGETEPRMTSSTLLSLSQPAGNTAVSSAESGGQGTRGDSAAAATTGLSHQVREGFVLLCRTRGGYWRGGHAALHSLSRMTCPSCSRSQLQQHHPWAQSSHRARRVPARPAPLPATHLGQPTQWPLS